MTTDPFHVASQQALLRRHVNRRRFLSMVGGAGALTVAGCAAGSSGGSVAGGRAEPARNESVASGRANDDETPKPSSSEEPGRRRPANPTARLVVIEMAGGNDGLATLQPMESGILRDRREGLLPEQGDLIDAGNGFGWHPNLAALHDAGLAAVVGVGADDPSFSHFEMEQRWWRGVSEDNSRVGTGFFGRLCDELDVGDPVTGLSFSGGPTPALAAEKSVTVGLTDPGVNWFFDQEGEWFTKLRQSYGAMALPSPDDNPSFAAARAGLANTQRFAESLGQIPPNDDDLYPWTDIGQQLRFASEVIDLDVGVRVMHVRQDGFDTHSGQAWRHPQLLQEFNEAVVTFIDDLDRRGHAQDTLVVTTSEFGRRVPENDGGTDHGGASTMMVCGRGRSGVHGDPPDLRSLDDGNVVATARFEDYYATIAEDWFGIHADLVLPTGGTPITGLL